MPVQGAIFISFYPATTVLNLLSKIWATLSVEAKIISTSLLKAENGGTILLTLAFTSLYACEDGRKTSIEAGSEPSRALNLPSFSPVAFLRQVHIDCEYVPFLAQYPHTVKTIGLLESDDNKLCICPYPAYDCLEDYPFEDLESLNYTGFTCILDEPISGGNHDAGSTVYSSQVHERDGDQSTSPYEVEECSLVNADTTANTVASETLNQTIAQIFLGNFGTAEESRTYEMTSLLEAAPMVFCPGFAMVGIHLSLKSPTL